MGTFIVRLIVPVMVPNTVLHQSHVSNAILKMRCHLACHFYGALLYRIPQLHKHELGQATTS